MVEVELILEWFRLIPRDKDFSVRKLETFHGNYYESSDDHAIE